MPDYPWFNEFPGAITITDTNGVILEMNDMAVFDVFKSSGGRELIGKNVLDCHPESARQQIESMLKNQQKNVYTLVKNGKKIFVYETPWYKEGVYSGIVELYLEIPFEVPNHIRG
jgi:hypothetical protein